MAVETGGSIGFPVGDTIQPTTGRKFLWIVLGIIIVLILAAILFPTIIMLTREDETKSTVPTAKINSKILIRK